MPHYLESIGEKDRSEGAQLIEEQILVTERRKKTALKVPDLEAIKEM